MRSKKYDYMEMPLLKNCFTTKFWTTTGDNYHISGYLLFIHKDSPLISTGQLTDNLWNHTVKAMRFHSPSLFFPHLHSGK